MRAGRHWQYQACNNRPATLRLNIRQDQKPFQSSAKVIPSLQRYTSASTFARKTKSSLQRYTSASTFARKTKSDIRQEKKRTLTGMGLVSQNMALHSAYSSLCSFAAVARSPATNTSHELHTYTATNHIHTHTYKARDALTSPKCDEIRLEESKMKQNE